MVDIEETNICANALLLTTDGKVILQQRDNNPNIINPGFISTFGGTLKLNEDSKSGLQRELLEELELNITPDQIEKFDTFYKTLADDGVDAIINVFIVRNINPTYLKLHEGKGFVCDFPEEFLKNNKLTRITRLALEKYLISLPLSS